MGRNLLTRIGPVVSAAFCLASSAAAAQSTRPPAGVAEARSSLNAAFEARNAADAGKWFADSAVADFGGEIHRGRTAISETWLPDVLGGLLSLSIGESTFSTEGDDVIDTASHTVQTTEGPDQGTHRLRWRRMHGEWRVVLMEVH